MRSVSHAILSSRQHSTVVSAAPTIWQLTAHRLRYQDSLVHVPGAARFAPAHVRRDGEGYSLRSKVAVWPSRQPALRQFVAAIGKWFLRSIGPPSLRTTPTAPWPSSSRRRTLAVVRPLLVRQTLPEPVPPRSCVLTRETIHRYRSTNRTPHGAPCGPGLFLDAFPARPRSETPIPWPCGSSEFARHRKILQPTDFLPLPVVRPVASPSTR